MVLPILACMIIGTAAVSDGIVQAGDVTDLDVLAQSHAAFFKFDSNMGEQTCLESPAYLPSGMRLTTRVPLSCPAALLSILVGI